MHKFVLPLLLVTAIYVPSFSVVGTKQQPSSNSLSIPISTTDCDVYNSSISNEESVKHKRKLCVLLVGIGCISILLLFTLQIAIVEFALISILSPIASIIISNSVLNESLSEKYNKVFKKIKIASWSILLFWITITLIAFVSFLLSTD